MTLHPHPGESKAEKLHIIWIDDQPDTLAAWSGLIEGRGDRLVIFGRTHEAIDYIEKERDGIDLVFVDHYLAAGDLKGTQAIEELHAKWAFLRLVLVTGRGEEFKRDFPSFEDIRKFESKIYGFSAKHRSPSEIMWMIEHVRREKALERTAYLDNIGPEAVKQILDAIADEVMVIDGEDELRRVLYTNKARRAVHGDIVGMSCYEVLSPSACRCARCIADIAREGTGSAARFDHEARLPSGKKYHVSERATIFTARGRERVVNVVRNEEKRFLRSHMIEEIRKSTDEDELFSILLKHFSEMGYDRCRIYLVTRHQDRRFLLAWCAHPNQDEWLSRLGAPPDKRIVAADDPYWAETEGKGDIALHTAWVLGRPPWADTVGFVDGETWVEAIIRREGEPYALVVIDNHEHSKERPVTEEDRDIMTGIARSASAILEIQYGQRERRFLTGLHEEIGAAEGPREALVAVVRCFKRFLEADTCAVFTPDVDGRILERQYGLWGPAGQEREVPFPEEYTIDDPDRCGLTGTMFRDGIRTARVFHDVHGVDGIHKEYCRTYDDLLGRPLEGALFLPMISRGRIIGLLRAFNRSGKKIGDPIDFTPLQARTAELAAGQITPILRDLIGLDRERERSQKLEFLTRSILALESETNPNRVMDVVAREATELLRVRGCSVFTEAGTDECFDLYRDGLIERSAMGETIYLLRSSTEPFFVEGMAKGTRFFYRKGEGLTRDLLATASVITRNTPNAEAANGKFEARGMPPYLNLLGTRLTRQRKTQDSGQSTEDSVVGMLYVVDKLRADGSPDPFGFRPEDEQLLGTLLPPASIALNHAWLIDSQARAVARLTAIHRLTDSLQSARTRDHALSLFLTYLTIGDGLGFNRAVLFLPDQKRKVLAGEMAIGPVDAVEADYTWSNLTSRGYGLDDATEDCEKKGYDKTSRLHVLASRLRFPCDAESPELPVVAFLGKGAQNYDFGPDLAALSTSVSPDLYRAFGNGAFALAPLVFGEERMGVVYVDNRFNAKPIKEEDIQLLEVFCAKAAIVLATHRSVGDTTAAVVQTARKLHDLKNLLVAHDLALTNLKVRFLCNDRAGALVRLDRLQAAIGASKDFTTNLLERIRETEGRSEVFDLATLLRDLQIRWRRTWADLRLEIRDAPLTVHTNGTRVEQVLTELVHNAGKATDGRGRVRIQWEVGASSSKDPTVLIRVEDDGPGLLAGTEEAIFTGKERRFEKGQGMGLGQARHIAQDDLGGDLHAEQCPTGACFVLTFPLSKMEGNAR